MTPAHAKAAHANLALVAASALVAAVASLAIGCGGAAQTTPAATADAAAARREVGPSSASMTDVTKVAGVDIVPGTRRMRVASAEGDEGGDSGPNAPAIQLLMPRGRAPAAARTEMTSEPFSVASLPTASIPEPLAASNAPSSAPVGDDAPEIFVDWPTAMRNNSIIPRPDSYTSVRVSLRGQKIARLRIGGSEGTVINGGGGGVYVVCHVPEDAPRRFVSARWETLSTPWSASPGTSAAPPGAAASASASASQDTSPTLTVTDAWFDMHECKATIMERTTVKLKVLAGGMAFAYREPCAKCAPGASTEMVTFLGPMPQSITASGVGGDATTSSSSALTRVSLPVRKGGGGTMLARYASGVARDWLRSVGAVGAPENDMIVGVDITQAVGDPEPVAIAYASRVEEPSTVSAEQDAQFRDAFRPTPPMPQPKKASGNAQLVDPFVKQRRLGF